jgi:CheY-like chemotaxis protein
VFVLTLALPLDPESEARALPRLDGQHVLVVDDDPIERATYQRWLGWVGAEAQSFESSAAARNALAAGARFDAAVLDSRMPLEGGLALAESLRRDGMENVVVAFHMNHREEDLSRAASLGVNSIHKPMRIQALVNGLVGAMAGETADETDTADLRARVLVADDSPDNLLLVESFAKGTDLELVCVEDGLAATKAVETGRFDLVLMDVSMPVLDGLEATRRIRAWEQLRQLPRTPIVALSAHALREHFQASEAAGCDEHVVKPFDRATLLDTIARHAKTGAKQAIAVDPEIADLVPAYLKRRRTDLAHIRAALTARNFDEVKTLGHRMKGSGAGYGFPRISAIGAELEQAAQRLDPQGIERSADALESFLVDLDAPRRPRDARATTANA